MRRGRGLSFPLREFTIMSDATSGRTRTIAAMLRSLRAKQGSLSIASRLKEAGLESYAEHLAAVYSNIPPTEAELIRSLNLHAARQPQCFYTQEEIVKLNRERLSIQQTRKRIITDIDRNVVKSLTPREKLEVANGEPLPRRFELKIYGNDTDE